MIQRIQSVYLFLSVIAMGLLLYLPVWGSVNTVSLPPSPVTSGNVGVYAHPLLLLTWVAAMLVQLVTIFMFKKRKIQIRMGQSAILLNVLFLIASFFLISYGPGFTNALHNFKAGAILPFISIFLLILANRNIRKDEELIRSMNRLR
jgi:hypothetical protein